MRAMVFIVPHATIADRNALSGAGLSLPLNFQWTHKTKEAGFNLESSSDEHQSWMHKVPART